MSLVVLYNHRYEGNIERVESLYRAKFDVIWHLVPFYTGHKVNVVPVYDTSHCFQSFVAQAYHRIVDPTVSHYVFIADDLVLNPRLDKVNILKVLTIGGNEAYLKRITPLAEMYFPWVHTTRVLEGFRKPGFAYLQELPTEAEAARRIAGAIGRSPPSRLKRLRHWNGKIRLIDIAIYGAAGAWRLIPYFLWRKLPYPMVAGYSDFFVIPANCLREFARLCGVLGALNVFAEVAIPTALVLACDAVVTENSRPSTGSAATGRTGRLVGRELWRKHEIEELERMYNRDMAALLNAFDPGLLYIHPVKISRWTFAGLPE